MTDVQRKVSMVQDWLRRRKGEAVRLRSIDWFQWITGGASNYVLLSAETGIAEVLVTMKRAVVLTTTIEDQRLRQEELTEDFEVLAFPWFDNRQADAFVKQFMDKGLIYSDRPKKGELAISADFQELRYRLSSEEISEVRNLGRDSAEAMTDAFQACTPNWSELDLAAEAARNLLRRNIEPCLLLVAGEKRLNLWRHPRPTSEILGKLGMMVFCARRKGLYANFTRFVSFRDLSSTERQRHEQVAFIEAEIFNLMKQGLLLTEMFQRLCQIYRDLGLEDQIELQHFGGLTGYLSREIVASQEMERAHRISPSHLYAWNPTLPGAKIEDTVLLSEEGKIEILTTDLRWPVREVAGRQRPDILQRSIWN